MSRLLGGFVLGMSIFITRAISPDVLQTGDGPPPGTVASSAADRVEPFDDRTTTGDGDHLAPCGHRAEETEPGWGRDAHSPRNGLGRFVLPTTAPAKEPAGYTRKSGVTFVRIKAGTFPMESPRGAKGQGGEAHHAVKLTQDYYLGAYEVTRGQFRKFIDDSEFTTEAEAGGGWGWDATAKDWKNGRKYSWRNAGFPQPDDHPVVIVTWNDAAAFCNWLSGKSGLPASYVRRAGQWEVVGNPRGYRLPTEAEWEYACRAGTGTRYSFGDEDEDVVRFGNVADTAFKVGTGKGWGVTASDGHTFTAPVGSFRPNPWGLYDMHGNVCEWCEDWSGKYPDTEDVDPRGPSTGNHRVCRGGSWAVGVRISQSGYRDGFTPDRRDYALGFRLALTVSEK